MKKISLAEALEGIEDTRRERSVMYPLIEILMIVLLRGNVWGDIIRQNRIIR